jgi:hypothetical protein
MPKQLFEQMLGQPSSDTITLMTENTKFNTSNIMPQITKDLLIKQNYKCIACNNKIISAKCARCHNKQNQYFVICYTCMFKPLDDNLNKKLNK